MTKYKVDLSEPAEKNLIDMTKYIASQLLAPISAYQMMEMFEEAMAKLSDSPQGCPLIADERLSQLGYRKLIVKNDSVFFSVNEKNKVI